MREDRLMRVRLTRVIGGSALRTDTVDGEATYPPREGHIFELIGVGLEFGSRLVTTSLVTKVHGDGSFETRTGSRYHVAPLEGPALDTARALGRRLGQA
jgi:hypothetical protein